MLSVINLYKDDPRYKELEIRMYIDPRQRKKDRFINRINISSITETIKNIIRSLINIPGIDISISKTIEFIRDQAVGNKRKKLRLQISYPGRKRSYSSKKEIQSVEERGIYGTFKVSLSEEKDIPDDESLIELYNFIRIKLRLSFIIPDFDCFRYDITFVKNLSEENIAILEGCKNKMLPNAITSGKILRYLPFGSEDHIEIEAELIGDCDLTPSLIMKAVNQIYSITDSKQEFLIEYQSRLEIISKFVLPNVKSNEYVKNLVLRRLYNSVKELSRMTYFQTVWPTITNWWLTDKADGKRAIVIITDRTTIISDKLYYIDEPTLKNDDITIVDAELIYHGDSPLKPQLVLFIFDVIAFKGENLANKPFGDRKKYLTRATNTLNQHHSIAQEKDSLPSSQTHASRDQQPR